MQLFVNTLKGTRGLAPLSKPIFPIFHHSIIPIILFTLLLVFHRTVFARYHPEIKWKEIANKRFIVVFPGGYQDEAVYTLNTAQQLYDRLTQLWGTRIPGKSKIRILMSDVYDDSNGSATFFPYNRIEIYLFTPPPDSTIGSGKDWIRLVLSHELTHIINFNMGSGFTYFMRKILGSNPLLYPIIYMPEWIMEGLAVYAESRMNEGGRLNTPDFKLMLGHIARAGRLPDWGDFWGEPTSWPGGTSKYLYGAAFVNFLVEKYGPHKIPQLVKTFAYYPIPFTFTRRLLPKILNIHQRFKQVFKKNTTMLWNEFLQHIETRTKKNINSKLTVLTQKGKFNKYPVLTRDEKIFYVNHNYKEYPGIYVLDIRTGKSKRLIKKSGINGLYYSEPENKIYFSAADHFKTYYRFSDIYSLDLKSRRVKQLTRGSRLLYPGKAPPERDKIYCVKRLHTRSYLAVLNLNTGSNKIISTGFDSMAYIAVSPDNRWIAVSLKRKNQEWAIALFNRDGRLEKVLTEGCGKCYYPAWKNADELFFVCQYEDNYRLASLHMKTNAFIIYNDPHLPSIRFFSLQPGKNKDKLAVSFFDANGYNLGLVDLELLKKKTKPKIVTVKSFPVKEQNPVLEPQSDSPGQYKIKPYNFLRELVPKYISGNYRYSGNEFQPGIIMSSHDLSSQNSFTLQAFYGFRSKTANVVFTYTYDGLYPGLSLRYSDLSDFNRSSEYGNFIHNERKLELIGFYPLLVKAASQAYLYSNIHFETGSDRFLDLPREIRVKLNGIQLGFFYNSAKRYYDSISRADGIGLSLSYSREFKFMGSDYDINTAALQYKHYISLFRPNVLALHLGIMDSWGEARRLFYMGGAESKAGFHVAGNNLFDLMRGYPSGYFAGTGGYLFNIEYRLALFKIENVFWMFRSIERLYLSLFADLGHVWTGKWTLDPSYSLGMELNIVAFLGDLKFNASVGIAVGQRPYHSPMVYLRIGNSF
ncbi:MAG: hypothetical protein JSV88_01605 [Candidatus Aminicenantes bacterium]|nr:MAG: hypothetical protein JSV88_01605 [Candidatus Aminicenantes bacterium]